VRERTAVIKKLAQFAGLKEDEIIILPMVPPAQRSTYHNFTVVKTVPNKWENIAEGLPTYESASIIKRLILTVFKK
jgi:hypothetical protein